MPQQEHDSLKEINFDYFENIIIYNALIDKLYLGSIIDVIDPLLFKNKDIQLIVNIVIQFFKKCGTVPNSSEIKTYLLTEEDKAAYVRVVNSCKTIDTNFNNDKLLETTERFFKERSVYNCLNKYTSNLNKGQLDTSKIYDDFNKACNISLDTNLGTQYFKDIDKHITYLKQEQSTISSGWQWLDDKLGGGWLKDGRALYTYAGVTNVGKSIVLGNIATFTLSLNKVVLLISLEMSEDVYSSRVSTQLTKIPFNDLKNKSNLLKNTVLNYAKTHDKANLIIKEYPPSTIKVLTIKAYIDKLIHKGIKPDIIVIDYINLILPNGKATGNKYDDVKLVTEQLRALTYTFQCPIITATQLGRVAIGKADPGMETTSESIGISFTSDVQISIWQNDQDKELGYIHFSIMKNRFGPAYGTACLKLDYSTLSITEIKDSMATDENINKLQEELSIV